MSAELQTMVDKVTSEHGEKSARVVYYEHNELGVTFAAILGESGTVYHFNAYGDVSDYEATPVTL